MARNFYKRKESTTKTRGVIRIYTEGEQTEPNYLNSIRDELKKVEIDIKVHGTGDHTMPLVESVIKEKNRVERTDEETVWWVVIDRDDHKHFNECIERAEANGINVAYSNESFELWFILHFQLLETAIGRKAYESKLTELLEKKYDKSMDVYSLIKDKEGVAIRHAKQRERDLDDEGVTLKINRDPSTTVFKLVESLRGLNT